MTDEETPDYFHLYCHPNEPGYFHFRINYKEPEEFSQLFGKNEEGESYMFDGYTYLFSLPLPPGADWREFKDYAAELMRDTKQIDVYLGPAYKIDSNVIPQQLIDNYPYWKQEKERKKREFWLEQARKESKGQYELF